ncbi:hypothetical protein ALP58_102249 [Pseudomonas savastanoi]|uniref:Uncharacterized protein n=11 Tax=Pseudomonas syringae group TaxID=136849 RepID=A0A3M5ZW81_PSESS|nr:Unknown protein sequence [Pseudomonas savastanoi pv. phaseolicola]KPB73488.1 Unknown protein sequence [Pseudomonas amygdali pv. mellea]KPB82996.1 Unknown protein sequence [Pseudomonas syringae pv. maculicola]KPW65918.1 hypothetical protein ALO78_102033 [Pseudomonas amygdali pv. ciccaronei]KPW81757.1 hypothetical protein ALO50_102683 [Pseudomonas syringae pv. cerasicola]KPW93460.1 hypothetical protein ALO79_100589 [Pseudomonas syringae pv. castaneae]KPX03900.1 hypothetical protein ALO74_102
MSWFNPLSWARPLGGNPYKIRSGRSGYQALKRLSEKDYNPAST